MPEAKNSQITSRTNENSPFSSQDNIDFGILFGFFDKTSNDASETDFKKILADLRFIKARYGLLPKMHKITSVDESRVRGEKMTFQDAVEAVTVLREELGKYPPDMIKKSGITHFRILERMTDDNYPDSSNITLQGLASEAGGVYVANGNNDQIFRTNIHHELWHRLEYQRFEFKDAIPFLKWLDNFLDSRLDSGWNSINSQYNLSYQQEAWRSLPAGIRPVGFTQKYGTKNSHEDRASFAEDMMTNWRDLMGLRQGDKALNAKVDQMITLFEEFSDGRMNKQFFQDLSSGKVNEEYWDNNDRVKPFTSFYN